MASIQEKLADSLSVLKKYQDENNSDIIQGMKTLGETHTKRLIDNGYLEQVIKGWYMPTMPGMEGDTTVWYASYWKFIVAYSNNRFGDNWCLTPEESLDFYAGETVAPTQLIIRSSKASNNIVSLKHGDSMLDITATMPAHIVVEQRYGLRLYPWQKLWFSVHQHISAETQSMPGPVCHWLAELMKSSKWWPTEETLPEPQDLLVLSETSGELTLQKLFYNS